jgi:SNF2 family DNA or RNA helicase
MDLDTFTRYFCHVDDQGKVRGNRADHIDELRVILKSFSLRRLKKDVLPELGAIDIQEWYVKPDTRFAQMPVGEYHEAQRQEAQLRAQLQGKSAEDLLIFLAGGQEFSTLRRYNALLKAPAVFDTVKFELENGLLEKVVVFGYHKEALAALHTAFQRAGIPSALIYGNTPKGQRDGIIEEWKRSGAVLLASTTIASTVLDLTAAHQGIALELTWVPGDNSQAMQRMHRHGQENPVTVRVAIGTPVDEIVSTVLLRKTRDLAEIFD